MKIFAATIFLLCCCGFSFAHSCVSYSLLDDKKYSDELQKPDAIFLGRVISISEPDYSPGEMVRGTQMLRIRIIHTWKGTDSAETFVSYHRAYSPFDEEIGGLGTERVFYCWRVAGDQYLHTWYCSFRSYNDDRASACSARAKLSNTLCRKRLFHRRKIRKVFYQ